MNLAALMPQEGQHLVAFLVKGGIIMLPLLASSVMVLAVIFERGVFWTHLRLHEADSRILSLVAQGAHQQALGMAQASPHPVARVLHAGLAQATSAPGMAMAAAAQTEVTHLRRYLPILDTIITLAPLLGLLGTITGMINAFGIISTGGMAQPHALTGGIAEALIATASGLTVAILTLIPYNYFQGRAVEMAARMAERATRLELLLHKDLEARTPGSRMRIPRSAPHKARIEIIPMIDIIFFLLVFFMLSTLSMTSNFGLPVDLPTADTTPDELGESLTIRVTRAGDLALNEEPLALADLRQRVQAGVHTNPDLLAIVNADEQAVHGAIVEVLETLRLAGISRLAIAVTPPQRTPP